MEKVAQNASIQPSHIEKLSRISNQQGCSSSSELENTLEFALKARHRALDLPSRVYTDPNQLTEYRPDLINTEQDLERVKRGLSNTKSGRIVFYGPPGTGKTAYARYLAQALDCPVHVKKVSDILSKWVGESEKNIARMFEESAEENAVLLLDEADSLLRDRASASNSWEVTQVNELLTQMESYTGIFIASTNLYGAMDKASIRRFDLKIRFDHLNPAQVKAFFQQILTEHKADHLTIDSQTALKIEALEQITPGDFSAVMKKLHILGTNITPESLANELCEEMDSKNQGQSKPIGFITH